MSLSVSVVEDARDLRAFIDRVGELGRSGGDPYVALAVEVGLDPEVDKAREPVSQTSDP